MKRLTYPIRSKYFERAGNPHIKASLCSLQGRRTKMEDSHVMRLDLPNHADYCVFGIFDGHNGKGAAQYLSENIANELDKLTTLDDPKSIQNRIMQMDREFIRTEKGDHGSCMVFVVIKPLLKDQTNINTKRANVTSDEAISDVSGYQISVFWAGDSRCLWMSPDKSKGMTKDHVPTNTKEKERIEKAEGSVVSGRVDSRLAVSRAFGDSSLKSNIDKSLDKQKVVALCDYQTFTANPGDWLLLFCDGLTEKWTNEQIADRLKYYVNSYKDPAHALGYMFDEALNIGVGDNITACLIQLQNGVEHAVGLKSKTFLPGPLYTVRHDPDFVRAYMENAELFGHFDNPRLRLAAYQEDLNFLNRFGRNDPDYNRLNKEIQDTIQQMKVDIGNITDQSALTYDQPTLTNTGTINDRNVMNTTTTDRNVINTGNKNISTTTTEDISSGNGSKRRRVTLDQWVYVYDDKTI